MSQRQTVNSNSTVAFQLAQDKLEELQARVEVAESDLCPGGGEHAISAKAGVVGIFDRCWRVAPSNFGGGLKQIDVKVAWHDYEPREITVSTLQYTRGLTCGALSLFQQDGVTLIEQVVSLLLGSVLITSLYAYFRAELYRTASVESKTASLEDARGALDIILRDLMNAGSLAKWCCAAGNWSR